MQFYNGLNTSFSQWWIESGCARISVDRLLSFINFQTIYRKYKLLHVKWYIRTRQAYRVNSTKYQRQRSSLNCKRNKTLREEFLFSNILSCLPEAHDTHRQIYVTYVYMRTNGELQRALENFKSSYRKKGKTSGKT